MVAAPLKTEEAATLVKENEKIFAFKRKINGLVEDDSGSGEGVMHHSEIQRKVRGNWKEEGMKES